MIENIDCLKKNIYRGIIEYSLPKYNLLVINYYERIDCNRNPIINKSGREEFIEI